MHQPYYVYPFTAWSRTHGIIAVRVTGFT
jgi:hypothetical protein